MQYSEEFLRFSYLPMIQKQGLDRQVEFLGKVKAERLAACWNDVHRYRFICDPRFDALTKFLYKDH